MENENKVNWTIIFADRSDLREALLALIDYMPNFKCTQIPSEFEAISET